MQQQLGKITAYLRAVFSLDLRSLALMRVCLSIMILADLWERAHDLTAHYTDAGVLPRDFLLSHSTYKILSLHMLSGKWEFEAMLFIIAAVCALMLLVGYKTTFAIVASFILNISLQNRNLFVLSGADQVIRMLLFWGMFLPLSARFSIDSIKKVVPSSPTFFSFGSAGYIMQMISIYIFAAMLKTSPIWRVEGTAIYITLRLGPFATSFGTFLLHFPWLLKIMTYGTFALEAFGTLLLFIPYRREVFRIVAVFSFVGLHVGIGLSMILGIFPLICVTGWLGILPALFWDTLFAWLKKIKATHITVYFDDDCGFCDTTMSVLKTFFLLPHAKVLGGSGNKTIESLMEEKRSWVVEDAHGKKYFGFDGFIVIAKSSPVLFLLAPVFGWKPFAALGERIYRYISDRNHRNFCEIAKKKPYAMWFYKNPVINVIAIFFIISLFFWNITTLPGKAKLAPVPLREILGVLRIDQKWNMFAPAPLSLESWFVIPAKTVEGEWIDVYNNRPYVSFKKPDYIRYTYKNTRWQKYLSNISQKKFNAQAKPYALYLCRSWNNTHTGDEKIQELSIYVVTQRILYDYKTGPANIIHIKHANCLDKVE